MDRVMAMLPTLPTAAQQAILAEIDAEARQGSHAGPAPANPAGPPDPQRDQALAQGRAEAWKLAHEREGVQPEAAEQAAQDETAELEGPGGWPPDWPGGSG
jgi:hypothetical protein